MIGLDTNILARYYIDDEADTQAHRQRMAARRLMESGQPLMVSKSVVLEFERVMRGYHSFAQAEVASVIRHLLGQENIVVEDREAVELALSNCEAGLDFVDALHHAGYRSCSSVATSDDRKVARRAKKLGLVPAVPSSRSRGHWMRRNGSACWRLRTNARSTSDTAFGAAGGDACSRCSCGRLILASCARHPTARN